MQDGQNGATLPAFLTNVCNKMILNSGSTVAVPGSPGLDWSCNGFFFDNATQIATFRSTQGGSTIDIPHSDEACNTPTGVTWVRNSGEEPYLSTPMMMRPTPTAHAKILLRCQPKPNLCCPCSMMLMFVVTMLYCSHKKARAASFAQPILWDMPEHAEH